MNRRRDFSVFRAAHERKQQLFVLSHLLSLLYPLYQLFHKNTTVFAGQRHLPAYSLLPDPCDREGHTQPPTDLGERHHVRQPEHFCDPSADAVVQDVDREREVDIDERVLFPQLQIVRVPGRAQNLPDRRRMLFQLIVCLDLLRDLLVPAERLIPRRHRRDHVADIHFHCFDLLFIFVCPCGLLDYGSTRFPVLSRRD